MTTGIDTSANHAFGQATWDLGLRLLNTYGAGDNAVLSPACIAMALGMAWAGAQGETRRQLAQVAHSPEDSGRIGKGLEAVLRNHEHADADDAEFRIANAFFVQQGLHVRDTYLQALTLWWKSHLFGLDFARDPKWAGARINQWVEGETQGKIRQLIPPDAFDSLQVAVLVSALYFKGLWAEPFLEQATRREPFWMGPTERTDVFMMHAEGRFNYMETQDCQVLELPYRGGAFSMLVCLPRRKDGLECVEQSITLTAITGWLSGARNRDVQVSLPRFSVRMDGSIKEPLMALDLLAPFDEAADFSGITTDAPLMLSDVFHGALVEVNETGTVAAAGCAACFGVTMREPDAEPPWCLPRTIRSCSRSYTEKAASTSSLGT
jgi:serpin B